MNKKIKTYLDEKTNYQYTLTKEDQQEVLEKLDLVSFSNNKRTKKVYYAIAMIVVIVISVFSSLFTYLRAKELFEGKVDSEYYLGIQKLENYRSTMFPNTITSTTYIFRKSDGLKLVFVDELKSETSYNIVVLFSFDLGADTTISIKIDNASGELKKISCVEEFTTFKYNSLENIPNISVLYNETEIIFSNF